MGSGIPEGQVGYGILQLVGETTPSAPVLRGTTQGGSSYARAREKIRSGAFHGIFFMRGGCLL
jgi:hypothetical protein